MKKNLFLVTMFLLLIWFSKIFADSSSSIILTSEISKEKANYQIISLVYESDLSNSKKWKEYISLVNWIIKKFENNKDALNKLKESTDKILENNSKKSANDTTLSMVALLNAKVKITLLNFENDKKIEVDTKVETKNSTWTTSTWTTSTWSINSLNVDKNFNFIYNPNLTYKSNDWKVSLDVLNEIKKYSFMKWVNNTKYSWLEFSSVNCSDCAKLHNETVYEELRWRNPNINFFFFHLPINNEDFKSSEILECLWEQKWDQAFFSLLDKIYKDWKTDKEYVTNEALRFWWKEYSLKSCLENWTFINKIYSQIKISKEIFWIDSTSWIVIVNNYTWQFKVIKWAYSRSYYENIIDNLNKN